MKVKKLLAVILSVVLVMSCTMICASAETKSFDFTSGKMYASIISTSARAYTEYVPGSYYIKRSVSATVYYRDKDGAMQNKKDSKTVMQGDIRATVEFTGTNFISMTSTHILGDVSKNISVDV